MRKSDEILWHQNPTRQAPVAIALIIFDIIKSLIRTWWPFILIFIFRSNFISADQGKILVGGVTIFVVLFSIWRYFRFHFFTADEKLHVQSGVFTRAKLDIPFDRIQSISFEQNILHQLFNVVRLKVDTAGSSKEEFEFAALEKSRAKELREFILRNRKEIEQVDEDKPIVQNQLVRLSISDLLKVGVSQNHLRTTGIILAFLLGLRERISDSLGVRYVDQFDYVTDRLFENIWVYGFGLFLLILVLSFFGTLVFSLLRYYDLQLVKTTDGYKVEAGLFNKREQAARDQKIQIVRWVTNPIRNFFKIAQLRFFQASSSAGTNKTSITVPGVPRESLKDILAYYLGDGAMVLEGKAYGIDKRFFKRRILYVGVLPTLALVGVAIISGQIWWYVAAVLYFIFIGIFQYFLQKKWLYQIDNRGLVTRSGVIERTSRALLLHKVQGVQIRQSPYQHRKALANVIMHTASGDVTIPYVSLDVALRIKNYVLFRVESSRLEWM